MTDKERIAWVINWIKREKRLSNPKMAKMWGIDKNTVAAYSKGEGVAKGPVLASMVRDFGINGEWLIGNIGEPFPGARFKHPEVCGSDPKPAGETSPHLVGESFVPYNDNTIIVDVDKAMGRAYRIITSGTAFAVALDLNLKQFAEALDTGIAFKISQDEVLDLQAQINELRREIDNLKKGANTTKDSDDSFKEQVM